MFEKRGQFTIFVILGFVLISTFAFLFFARSLVVQDKLQIQADEVIERAIKSNNLNVYVKSCIDRISEDAIYLMSLQGGKIYESQGGSYPNPQTNQNGENYLYFNFSFSHKNISFYESANVSYGIKPNLNTSCVYPQAPYYPLANTSISMVKSEYYQNSILSRSCDFYSGALGIMSLPKLCEINGSNKPIEDISNPLLYVFGLCKFGYEKQSVQEQLQNYVANSMSKCANFTIFDNMGYNITSTDEPFSTIAFSDKFFVVNISYPLKVFVRGKHVHTKATFEQKKELRIKYLYEYIQQLLEKEYKDINFNIESDYKSFDLGWDSKIKVERVVNPCKNCVVGSFDDIFQVIDDSTLVRGNPLVFQFAIKNRAPILDFIDVGQKYNLVVKEGELIEIKPFGLDPDENNISYDYSGWREDYTEKFVCTSTIENCRTNPESYMVKNPNSATNNWTKSQKFINTQKDSEYKTSREDIGIHRTQVYVVDEEGTYDYQDVTILVGDTPKVIPSGENFYSDISPRNASIEDAYILNAETQSYFTSIFEFEWIDSIDPFIINTPLSSITLPFSIPIDQLNINNIKTEQFVNAGFNGLMHTLGLKGRYGYSGPTSWTPEEFMEVQVNLCLAHSSNAPPYPYNNWTEDDDFVRAFGYTDNENDAFQADHACCVETNGWGVYQPSSHPCYEYIDYGSYWSIESLLGIFNWGLHNPNLPTAIPSYYSYGIGFPPIQNDIFKRTFTRTCSGNRGNTCTGTTDQRIETISCQDISWGGGGFDERCSGPALSLKKNVDDTAPACVNYLRTTFEKEFGDMYAFSSETGNCELDRKCSSSNDADNAYGAGGNYLCQGTCDGQGNCDQTMPSICYNCLDDDTSAGGEISDNPSTRDATCIGGNLGSCSSDVCISPKQSDEQDFCAQAGNQWFFYEAYAFDSNGNSVKESCRHQTYDLDSSKAICEYNCDPNINPDPQWITASGDDNSDNCCGNSNNEFIITNYINNLGGTSGNVCCNQNNKCGFDGKCYANGYTGDVNGDTYPDTCNNKVWTFGTCSPLTCAYSAYANKCGVLSDGCGSTINCGLTNCGLGQVCDTSQNCCSASQPCPVNSCGAKTDNCGQTYSCNNCQTGFCPSGGSSCASCNTASCSCNFFGVVTGCPGGSNCKAECYGPIWNRQCRCNTCKTSCATGECGNIDNGCGGTINCGGCSANQYCGGSNTCAACSTSSCSCIGGIVINSCSGTCSETCFGFGGFKCRCS